MACHTSRHRSLLVLGAILAAALPPTLRPPRMVVHLLWYIIAVRIIVIVMLPRLNFHLFHRHLHFHLRRLIGGLVALVVALREHDIGFIMSNLPFLSPPSR